MNIGDPAYPLTHPQKRIWFVEQIHPHTSLHHLMAASFKRGEMDFAILDEAINLVIQENEGVRLKLREEQGEIRQYVGKWTKQSFHLEDFSSFDDPKQAFEDWMHARSQTPFTLTHHFLFTFYRIRLQADETGFVFIFHHIIADGWSLTQMMNRIWQLYASLLDGHVEPREYPTYLKYLDTESAYMSSPRFAKNEAFWTAKYETLPEGLTVRNSGETKGKRKSFLLDSASSEAVKRFAASEGCSVNTLFVLLALLHIQMTTGQQDLIIGTPVLNRSGQKEKATFGMYTSTVPFRYFLDDTQTLRQLLSSINEELLACYFHQKYPYDLLVQKLQLQKQGYSGLFDMCVNYYNSNMIPELGGDAVETVELYSGNQLYSLQIVIKDWRADGRLLISFDYKTSDYADDQIERMWEHMSSLMQACLDNPLLRADRLERADQATVNRLLVEWNRTDSEYPSAQLVHELFEAQAEKTPEAVALYKETQAAMTYRELNEQANRLALYLREKGIARGSVVGIMASHSVEVIVAFLAVLKAGGAYVPIDPEYPVERLRTIMTSSSADLLLTNAAERLAALDYEGEIVDLTDSRIYIGTGGNVPAVNEPGDLAYIIYTSGSTGKPKGVMIAHRSLVNYSWWAKKHYIADSNEAFAFYSSISFDLTVTSVFAPLLSGNPVRIYADDGTDFVLSRILRDNVTHIVKLTPAHLALLKEGNYTSSAVRRFIVGGEDLKTGVLRSVLQSFGGRIEVFNEYGPTEATVGCMIHRFDAQTDLGASVPIGRPADNVQLYILDDRLRPLPVGSMGELYISGDGVAKGYFGRDDLTQERFLPNPFVPGKVMYKTGDLAKYRPDGVMEYGGRIDHQVKIRGYRIELSEIESRLLEHPAIRHAAVIDRSSADGSVHLCAYYVAAAPVDTAELRIFIGTTLPHYMIPSVYGAMEELPLTPNGKIDRTALPQIEFRPSEAADEPDFSGELERRVWSRYREVLQVSRLGRDDHFYQMGGDSIKAIQIAAKLHEDGIKVKVKDILAFPYFAEVAAAAELLSGGEAQQEAAQGDILPTPITEWFFEQRFASPHYWNQSVLLRLKQEVSADEVRLMLSKLAECHDALRINASFETGRLRYNPHLTGAPMEVRTADLSGEPQQSVQERIRELGRSLKSSVRIEDGAPMAGCLIRIDADGTQMLLLTAHHLVVDVVSWGILLHDCVALLEQIRSNRDLRLPAKTHSYQAWAERLHEYSLSIPQESESYWEQVAAQAERAEYGQLTQQPPGSNELLQHAVRIEASMTEEETLLLSEGAHDAYRTEANDLLMTALAMTVRDYTDGETVMIDVEGHGREELLGDMSVTRTVGWFTSLYPCCISLGRSDDPGELIKSVKEQLRAIPSKGFDYGVLRYLGGKFPNMPSGGVRFNYLGNLDTGFSNPLFEYSPMDSGPDHAPDNHLTCQIDIVAAIANKRLTISAVYGRAIGEQAGLHDFAERMTSHLRFLLEHCAAADDPQFTPSDFETSGLSQSGLDLLFD